MSLSIRFLHRFPRSHSLGSRSQSRPLSLAPSQARSYPRKNAQDRESIDTEATEYTKSGTDDGAARQEDAAFDPKQTRPEQEKNTAGEGGVRSVVFFSASSAFSAFSCRRSGSRKRRWKPKDSHLEGKIDLG